MWSNLGFREDSEVTKEEIAEAVKWAQTVKECEETGLPLKNRRIVRDAMALLAVAEENKALRLAISHWFNSPKAHQRDSRNCAKCDVLRAALKE